MQEEDEEEEEQDMISDGFPAVLISRYSLEMLRRNESSITALNLATCFHSGVKLMRLWNALSTNQTLRALLINHNRLISEDCVHVAEFIKENHSLICLHIGSNNFGDKGCRLLLEGLQCNTTLRELMLNNIGMKFEGCKIICEWLKFNTSLRIMDLSGTVLLFFFVLCSRFLITFLRK